MTVVAETFVFRGSSNLAEASYDPEVEDLTIDFVSGDSYLYRNVPVSVYKALCASPSPGSYFWRQIRGSYSYEQQ